MDQMGLMGQKGQTFLHLWDQRVHLDRLAQKGR